MSDDLHFSDGPMSEGELSAAGGATPVASPRPMNYHATVEDSTSTDERGEPLLREMRRLPAENARADPLYQVAADPAPNLGTEADEEYAALQERLQSAIARRLVAINQEIERVEQDTIDLRSRTGGLAY